ncbi:Glycosyltransferase involved in cell wall bisynthesis [Mesonia phycicola]|uniref:Glycosyltransferase involved in cell wall bisynthesis n=1 Tax=Mesonia phycicola TaxID=579105 RepID=A0A1M6GJB7_9FLAO|nr:glycosyltransferase [Mesonia phycicola]SHJ10016.1 Glycosyltransferase involved in cell wall bisynthesis [Mesonia phycicola]
MPQQKTLIIIPLFNEADRIVMEAYQKAFMLYTNIDFVLVNDASTDKTQTIMEGFANAFQNVFCVNNKTNKGKAESIRKGVLAYLSENYIYIGYLDADLATPFEEIVRLLNYATENPNKKIIMGARIKLMGNKVKRSLLRHYFGRVFATIISQFVLKTPVYDTQCGAKILEANLAKKIFKHPFCTKWLFDVELLLRFKKKDIQFASKIVEIPLNAWEEKGNSKIKLYEFFLVPFQLIKLYAHY